MGKFRRNLDTWRRRGRNLPVTAAGAGPEPGEIRAGAKSGPAAGGAGPKSTKPGEPGAMGNRNRAKSAKSGRCGVGIGQDGGGG